MAKEKQYRLLVTELWTSEYHVDANSKDEAIEKLQTGKAGDPVDSHYDETLRDRDSMYITEMDEENVS